MARSAAVSPITTPPACYPAAALGSGARILTNTREIAADAFFEGMFATALEEGEIITEVRFPVPQVAAWAKFAQPASRFALVGVFVARFADGVRVAVTGASSDGVFRWTEAEAALGASFEAEALASLSPPEGDMISDIHGSGDYRAHLVEGDDGTRRRGGRVAPRATSQAGCACRGAGCAASGSSSRSSQRRPLR